MAMQARLTREQHIRRLLAIFAQISIFRWENKSINGTLMAVLAAPVPPSSAVFNSGFSDTLRSPLKFHSANGSPFMINPYPFFAYHSNSHFATLAFCLFQPNSGRVDSVNGTKYMDMFDAQNQVKASTPKMEKWLIMVRTVAYDHGWECESTSSYGVKNTTDS